METVFPTVQDIGLTCLRWGIGLTLGSLLGLIIALAEAAFQQPLRRYLSSPNRLVALPLDFLRSLPIIALVPIVQMLGVEEIWKIGLIAWAVMFPVWVAVSHARAKPMIDTELVMLASGLDRAAVLRNYRIPKALGGFLKGVEISIGVAWLSVVAAEWVGTFSIGFWSGGLGYKIIKAHDANSWGGMLACLVLFGGLGSASSWIWRRLLSKAKSWTNGFDPIYDYRDEQA